MKLIQLRPMLESNDLAASIAFYTTILGFTLREKFMDEDSLCWCDLVKDNISIMFSLPNQHMNYGRILLSGSLYITVEDVDSLWVTLRDKCEIVYPIENFEHEMREFAIRDNNGYVLNFGEATK
jgi:uncharacterized glyoxalase superfamily protein PhnB